MRWKSGVFHGPEKEDDWITYSRVHHFNQHSFDGQNDDKKVGFSHRSAY